MKKKLQLSRETLTRLSADADLRALGAGVNMTGIRPQNPSVIDGCPSTPVWCPQFTQKPCPDPQPNPVLIH